jgi:hypothetical protein
VGGAASAATKIMIVVVAHTILTDLSDRGATQRLHTWIAE